VESKAEIGASISKDLKHAALIAIAISLAGIIVYLGWRFDLRFGIAAAVATFHSQAPREQGGGQAPQTKCVRIKLTKSIDSRSRTQRP
jgi:hypothetical protein